MAYQQIEKTSWKDFGDRVSRLLAKRSVELDVIGLDIGDQIEGERLTLDGLSYDPPDDTFHVFLQVGERGTRHLGHVIQSPRQIYLEVGDAGVSQLAVMDGAGREHLLRFSQPLLLPT